MRLLGSGAAALAAAILGAVAAHADPASDEATAAFRAFAIEYPNVDPATATPEQLAGTLHSIRASAEYQDGLRGCVNAPVKAIIARTTTGADTAAYCDAYAVGYFAARIADKLDAASRAMDASMPIYSSGSSTPATNEAR